MFYWWKKRRKSPGLTKALKRWTRWDNFLFGLVYMTTCLWWPFFLPFGYGKLLELDSICNSLNNSEGMTIFRRYDNNTEGTTIIQKKNDINLEGMIVLRREWHKVFFEKNMAQIFLQLAFFAQYKITTILHNKTKNLKSISFITFVRS